MTSWLRALFAFALILLPVAAVAQTIKIGMITTYSGPSASLGDYMDKGAELYLKLHAKDFPPGREGGRPACQRGVRDHSDGRGPMEGLESPK